MGKADDGTKPRQNCQEGYLCNIRLLISAPDRQVKTLDVRPALLRKQQICSQSHGLDPYFNGRSYAVFWLELNVGGLVDGELIKDASNSSTMVDSHAGASDLMYSADLDFFAAGLRRS